MTARRTILLLTFLLAWLGGIGSVWADVNVSTFAELQTALSGNEAIINITADITVTSQLTINRNVTIDGKGHILSVPTPYLNEDGTAATGASSGGVFTINSGRAVNLKNMTVMGGTCITTSAAINNFGTLTLDHVTMIRCNRGLYNYGSGAVAVLTNCVLIRNSAAYGGGLLNEEGQLLMDCCSFSENCSTQSGGGAAENKSGGIMYLNNVTMSNNFCSEKGALNNYAANADNQSTMYVMNSTITGNVTRDQFGAIARNGNNGKVNVVNSIITDNYYSNGGAWGQNDVTDGNYAYCVVEHHGGGVLNDCVYATNDNVFQGYTDSGIYTTVGTTTAFDHTTLVSTPSGQYVAPVSPTGPAASGGTRTYFSYTLEPTFSVSMSYDNHGVNTPLGELTISTDLVTTNQDGSTRATTDPIPIGSAKVSSPDAVYYTVRLGNGISHGSVTGATYYGDTYEGGTSITVTAIPDNGYVLKSWTVNGVEDTSTNNPYTFTLNSDVILVPVFLKDINGTNITVTVEQAYYTGSVITPVVTVKDGNTTLTSADYIISYKGSTLIDAKTYVEEIIITGKGNYHGTRKANFTILPRHISAATITVADMEWTGGVLAKIQGAADGYTIQYNGNNLTLNDDYSFYTSPATIQDAGTYSMHFQGIGNYTGTTVRTFNVKKDISNQNQTLISVRSQYQIIPDGSTEMTPIIEITDNATGSTLIQGTDFDISPTVIGADVSTVVTITGMAPRYSGSASLPVKGLKEYYARSTEPNTSVFDIHLTETTATGANAMLGNAAHGAVIDAGTTRLTLPASVTFTELGATIAITGIEDSVFVGCGGLRFIDAVALTDYVPSTLLRDIKASPFYGVPKQALVFLNGTTFTGENYVYYPGTGTNYYCDVFKVYDDQDGNQLGFQEATDYRWAFENPHAFTANTIVNTRMLIKDQAYTTCLPYNLPIPADVKAYTIGVSSSQLVGFEEVTVPMVAYTPYVIIPTASGQLLGTENALVPAFMVTDDEAKKLNSVSSQPESSATFTMGGTMRYIDGADAEGLYIMQGKDANGVSSWKQIQDGNGSYTDVDHKYCVLPMRAYIKSAAALSRPLLRSSFVNGVSEMPTIDKSDRVGTLYDLQGRKIQTPQRRGIYIKNGRRVIINKN